jgi:predicted house-cleaning noncanonical NTP pyrophosphatase (MazG superfamily)
MPTFLCNKLSFDKTLQNFKESNITATYRMLADKELLEALYKKLLEEAQEVTKTNSRAEVISELADLSAVVDGLCNVYDISHHEIEKAQSALYEKRGGFETGLFVETIEMTENNPAVQHFRKSPERYPEIS